MAQRTRNGVKREYILSVMVKLKDASIGTVEQCLTGELLAVCRILSSSV
jgi:hypothetical protein